MSLVREVKLVSRDGRPVLVQEAVDPFQHPGGWLFALDRQPLAQGVTWLPPQAQGYALRIDAEFEPGAASRVGLVLRADSQLEAASDVSSAGAERTVLAYNCVTGELSLDRTKTGNVGFHETFPSVERVALPLEEDRIRLRIFLDRCSVESSPRTAGRRSPTKSFRRSPVPPSLSLQKVKVPPWCASPSCAKGFAPGGWASGASAAHWGWRGTQRSPSSALLGGGAESLDARGLERSPSIRMSR